VLAVAVPSILLISWLSYRYVERPFLRGDTHSTARSASAQAADQPPEQITLR
jgi:peptidoglycan/LPS O-acetylase OafA/YrhL